MENVDRATGSVCFSEPGFAFVNGVRDPEMPLRTLACNHREVDNRTVDPSTKRLGRRENMLLVERYWGLIGPSLFFEFQIQKPTLIGLRFSCCRFIRLAMPVNISDSLDASPHWWKPDPNPPRVHQRGTDRSLRLRGLPVSPACPCLRTPSSRSCPPLACCSGAIALPFPRTEQPT
jgi:hypothetical protein